MKISGIPREQIPWHPTVDESKCTGCQVCVAFCSHGTYEFDEEKSQAKVAHPNNCVVGCTGCESQCPAGAISFPPLAMLSELAEKFQKDKLNCGGDCGCDSCG